VTDKTKSILLPGLLALVLAGCFHHGGTVNQLSPDVLFQNALTALQQHKYGKAQELFERFTIQYPTHARNQEARFHLAEAYLVKHEYVTAAEEFVRLASDFPAGAYADDARFKVCEAYYKLSPKPQLDQQYTRSAVDHCQSLLTYYPNSEFAQQGQQLLTDLRNKLALKEYLTGEFYYKRSAFDSAILYYEGTLRDYSDTKIAPTALMRLYQTYTHLNYKEEADAAKQRLLKDYPNSPEAKQLLAGAPVTS